MLLLFTDWQTEEMTSHAPTNGLKVAFSFKCQHLNTNIIVGRKIPAMLQASFTHNTTRVRMDFFLPGGAPSHGRIVLNQLFIRLT